MKFNIKNIAKLTLLIGCLSFEINAQIGKPFIHDPSTIMESDGKYYTFGTRGGGLVSEDGWTWNPGGERPGGGAAPDAVKIGDRYLIAYGATGGGLGGGHNGRILGLLLDPTDGRLWLSYGTYFGFIRLVELDPKTGKRVEGNKAIDVAIDCEASALMYRDGWYYLLGTHGTCCDGANSTYNIVVGRSKKVTGPYIDNMGRDMLKGGGKMVLGSGGGRVNGAGHFGHWKIDEGVEKMSLHYEADLDQSGRSVLAIRPLLWKNGWPMGGELFKEGTFQIESERRGYGLELIVDFVRMPGGFRGPRDPNEPIKPVPSQELKDVIDTWSKGEIGVRAGDYIARPHQKWTITAVPDGGGNPGGQYYKIVIAGTDRALAATAAAELITVPTFTGAAEQLWRIDQLIDGTYRIMPKVVPNSNEKLALISSGDSTPTLGKFDFNSDNSKWNFRAH
ncbi:MAG: family 43 glycosylhydrolase [Cytophagaceae bacterium]|nr:family 43 glycosylhydrolase [Cytophagaceae bacterium]